MAGSRSTTLKRVGHDAVDFGQHDIIEDTTTTDHLIIRLGREGEFFCNSPAADLELLGTVQEGQAVGALARGPDQRYVQLNGDFERELDAMAVEAALALQKWRNSTAESTGPATPPVVTVKRRRVPILPKA